MKPSYVPQPQAPHAMAPEAAARMLQADRAHGLSEADAATRRAAHGPNALPAPRRAGPWRRFFLQFHNVLIYVLLVAAAGTALLGHAVDAAVILGVVLINAVVGFLQEGRAERALDAIRGLLSPHAQVLRDGRRVELPAEALVPGDVVFLASGDKVPADLRLLQSRSLRIDEAALTGESQPVDKSAEPVAREAPLADRRCMAYSGTLVTYGQGVGVVAATGAHTELGRINAMLAAVEPLTTPLLRQIAAFARWLTGAILAASTLLFLFGYFWRGYAASEMFLAAVGLAVAAIPEGLPPVMTITLAIGVRRMARRQAIIRRLPAVEALGSVSVICTDKTGTLTRNEMTAQHVLTASAVYEVSGIGYGPHGGFSADGQEVDAAHDALLQDIARCAVLCNDAELRPAEGGWQLAGDPTEGALVALGAKAGCEARAERERWPRLDAIPFESEHCFMATLHHDHQGRERVYLKGAPERVLALCSRQRCAEGDAPLDAQRWHAAMAQAAGQGMRLLALAARSGDGAPRVLEFADVERGGFTLLAVVALSDPPREEAVRAVANCRSAGMRVKMITGDHATTAAAIGAQLHLADRVRTLTGTELEAMDDERLREAVARTDIFARAAPEHKLRIVRALQARGEVVAMTGDGVNDAPALKQADVGVAMGRKGTEAAKEAAEMVLADDNFASIAAAVEEGRTVYDNIRKAIVFILPTNGGEAGILLIAILLGLTLPITPVQILWVNMVTAVTLALALAFEAPEADLMRRPPRASGEPLLSLFLVWRIVLVTVLMVGGALGLFLWESARGETVEAARTAAVNVLVMGELVYLFNCRHFFDSALTREGLLGNRQALYALGGLVLLQLLFTYLPAMQGLFGTAALDAATWGWVLGFGALMLLLIEAEKWLLGRNGAPGSRSLRRRFS